MDATPWPEIADLLDYWFESPPVHLLVKAYMEYEAKDPDETRPMTEDELRAWAGQVTHG